MKELAKKAKAVLEEKANEAKAIEEKAKAALEDKLKAQS